MEVLGQLKVKFDTQVVSDRFSKREFVLTTEYNTPYPQHVSFQLTQDKCGILDNMNEGDEIKVQFNLRGREWNGPQGVKYFNTLEAWRIERLAANGQAPAPAQTQQPTHPAFGANRPVNTDPQASTFNTPASDDNDDLPF